MRYEGGSSMIEGHILINKKLPNGVLYLKGDNSDSYKDDVLTTSTRQLIYKGGEVPYTLVFDYAVSSNSKHTYTTNFYTDKDSTISILGTNKAKIVGGNNNESCYVYTYSLDGTVILSETKTDKTLAITTNNSSNVHKQATLFITNDNLGNDPIVEWNKIDGKLEIKIKYKVGTTEYIDTYFLSVNEEVVYTQTIIEPKHVHDLVKIEEVSATCTTKGNILYYHCNDCGENFTDVDGLNKVNKVEIDAKGHDYGEWNEEILPTKNSLGVVGHYYCSECDKYFDEYYDELDDIYLEYHDNSTTVNNGCYGQIAASLFGVMFLGACIVFVRKKYNL
jgi:Zn finger protein HypA/HybF involved in hydrogenase expression